MFEKKIERTFRVRRIGNDESRKAVKMDVKMGNEVFSATFSIADRQGFDYQGLIGRNVLTGRFIVDTSTKETALLLETMVLGLQTLEDDNNYTEYIDLIFEEV